MIWCLYGYLVHGYTAQYVKYSTSTKLQNFPEGVTVLVNKQVFYFKRIQFITTSYWH
jgi:hypothetical protein